MCRVSERQKQNREMTSPSWCSFEKNSVGKERVLATRMTGMAERKL
jgi:hypothetical protein